MMTNSIKARGKPSTWGNMIKITVDTMSPALEEFAKQAHGIGMTTRISHVVLRDTNRHFIDQMGPQGPWPELSPITIENRRKKSSTPLRDTGQLYRSAHITPTDDEAAVSWNKYDYFNHQNVAKLQNDGGRTRVRNRDGTVSEIEVPARPYAWLSDIGRGEIEDLPPEIVRRL